MDDVLRRIGQEIELVARQEDRELKEIANEGIFFMPELAFVYACGKAIMVKRIDVFGGLDVKWKREESLGNGGPTDLLFELSNGKCIAIEFKFRGKSTTYISDIQKLLQLKRHTDSGKFVMAFCALIDTFANKLPDDGRVGAVEKYFSTDDNIKIVSLLDPKPHFETAQHWYTSNKVECVIGFWEIKFMSETCSS